MKVLIVHNTYKEKGGEDTVYANEIELLRMAGNEVLTYHVDNDVINGFISRVRALFGAVFSLRQFLKIAKLLQKEKPDVVHVHNYFPLISPSVFYACRKNGVPVVHTLHNFRAICPTALLMHKGVVVERSILNSAWWAVRARVYKDSFVGSFAVACMVEFHKKFGTWTTEVDKYIALTQFARDKYIEAGWPENKIVVKPNFIVDPRNFHPRFDRERNYALYVGRLSDEKGVDLLVKAWALIDYPLKVVGDGPLRRLVEGCKNPYVQYLGPKESKDVLELMAKARFLVMASISYEGLPMVLVEAFASGTFAIVPKLGGMGQVVDDGNTGLTFRPGSSEDLRIKVAEAISNPSLCEAMSKNASREYMDKYSASVNYLSLIGIYKDLVDSRGADNGGC